MTPFYAGHVPARSVARRFGGHGAICAAAATGKSDGEESDRQAAIIDDFGTICEGGRL